MQSKYVLISIDDNKDIQKILIYFLKFLEYQYIELYIEKKIYSNENTTQMMVPMFGYFNGLLTQGGNTPESFSPFLSPMV